MNIVVSIPETAIRFSIGSSANNKADNTASHIADWKCSLANLNVKNTASAKELIPII